MKLLTREQFKESVFKKSKGKCVFCDSHAVDAHHILDRKLFPDGGYYLENGAAVCEHHHSLCEATLISVEEVRRAVGHTEIVLPPKFYPSVCYDKWGNIIQDDQILPGPLINDKGCLTALKRTGKIKQIYEILENRWK